MPKRMLGVVARVLTRGSWWLRCLVLRLPPEMLYVAGMGENTRLKTTKGAATADDKDPASSYTNTQVSRV